MTDRLALDVELAHPLYGEVVAASMPVLVARRLRHDLAEALPCTEGEDANRLLRIATWKLEAGDTDEELFVRASVLALRRGDPCLAHRLAESAGPGLLAGLSRAQARVAQACFDDVEPILAPLEHEAARASPEVAATYVETRFRASLRGTRQADFALSMIDRFEPWGDDRDWGALIETQRAWAALYQALPARALKKLRPFLDDDRITPARLFNVMAVAVFAMSRLGMAQDGEEIDRRLQHLIGELESPPWETRVAVFLVDVYVRLHSGSNLRGISDRIKAAISCARESGDRALTTVLLQALGSVELARGRLRGAVQHFEDAWGGLSVGDPFNITSGVMTGLAMAYGMLGEADQAEALLKRAEGLHDCRPNQGRREHADVRFAAAWVDVARGRASLARDTLLKAADEAVEDLVGEADALYGALRLGAPPKPCAQRLATLAGHSQSDLIRLYAAHAAAIAAADPEAQLESARQFERMGADLLAAEAASRAAACFRQNGRHASSVRAEGLASQYQGRCQGARTPALSTAARVPALTAREREIAALAARDLTNSQIAEQLVLSVRSVETYVLRACRKLGVNRRKDLAGALQGDVAQSSGTASG